MNNIENTVSEVNVVEVGLPTQISIWTKIRNFLFQEVKIEITPKQEKILQEVHDFWHQEITFKKIHDFLFQKIEIVDDIIL